MARDEKYYRRQIALTRFAFICVLLITFVVGFGLSLFQFLDEAIDILTITSGRRIFGVVILSILAVLFRVPDLLSELHKIDLGNTVEQSGAKSTKPYTKQLEHARQEGLIDNYNRLLKPRSDFVRFCVDYMYFYPYKRADWRILENVLKDSDGNPISAAQLAQTFQDIQTREGI